METAPQKFRAVIQAASNGGTYIDIPFDVEQVYGKKRVKVKALIEGLPYRGSLVRMGSPCHILGILKEIREQAGKQVGDEIEVILEEDTEPRLVTVPPDLLAALQADPAAEGFFQKLAYTHQKEYVAWIEEARRAETRADRLARVLEMLKQGKRTR